MVELSFQSFIVYGLLLLLPLKLIMFLLNFLKTKLIYENLHNTWANNLLSIQMKVFRPCI